jgi:hypothetical protein
MTAGNSLKDEVASATRLQRNLSLRAEQACAGGKQKRSGLIACGSGLEE